jgi:drug/metabolite transporter (DMT)-like permease
VQLGRIMPLSRQSQAYLALVSVVFSAASAPIAIRIAQSHGVPSIYIIALRLWITVVIMAPLAGRDIVEMPGRTDKKTWGLIVLAGSMHALGLVLLFTSLEYTSVLANSVIRRTSPFWIIILESLFLGAVFSRKIWVGLVFVIGGGVLVIVGADFSLGDGGNHVLGGLLAILDAFVNSIYLLIGRYLRRRLPVMVYGWYVFLIAALLTSALVLYYQIPLSGYGVTAFMWVLAVAIISQVLGHLPINIALGTFSATYVSLFMQLSLVLAVIFAVIWLAEVPTWAQVGGGLLVMIGVTLTRPRQAVA